jgi:RimJ/RimL family protein N-acetyltransferase
MPLRAVVEPMPGPVFLHGDGITLRVLERGDVPFVQRAANDPALRRRDQRTPVPLARAKERYEERDGILELLVCTGDDPVGMVGFGSLDRAAGTATLVHWLVPEARGEGYGREAVGRLLAYGFDELGLHRVGAEVPADDQRRMALLEGLGFEHEGTRREDTYVDGEHRDTHCYGLLASDREE